MFRRNKKRRIVNDVNSHYAVSISDNKRVRIIPSMNTCDHNFVEITSPGVLSPREWACGKCGYVKTGVLEREPSDEELRSAIDSLRVLEKSLESDLSEDD